jgi:hypothetical protein
LENPGGRGRIGTEELRHLEVRKNNGFTNLAA